MAEDTKKADQYRTDKAAPKRDKVLTALNTLMLSVGALGGGVFTGSVVRSVQEQERLTEFVSRPEFIDQTALLGQLRSQFQDYETHHDAAIGKVLEMREVKEKGIAIADVEEMIEAYLASRVVSESHDRVQADRFPEIVTGPLNKNIAHTHTRALTQALNTGAAKRLGLDRDNLADRELMNKIADTYYREQLRNKEHMARTIEGVTEELYADCPQVATRLLDPGMHEDDKTPVAIATASGAILGALLAMLLARSNERRTERTIDTMMR